LHFIVMLGFNHALLDQVLFICDDDQIDIANVGGASQIAPIDEQLLDSMSPVASALKVAAQVTMASNTSSASARGRRALTMC
jgi:hypothetical protein